MDWWVVGCGKGDGSKMSSIMSGFILGFVGWVLEPGLLFSNLDSATCQWCDPDHSAIPLYVSPFSAINGDTNSSYIIGLLCWLKEVMHWSLIHHSLQHLYVICHLLSSPTSSLYYSLPLCILLQRCCLLWIPQTSLIRLGHLPWNAHLPRKLPLQTATWQILSYWLKECQLRCLFP